MHVIEIDAKNWTNVVDFYRAILSAVGAPSWHGTSINALVDSMIWGGINSVEPPYTIRIRSLGQAPKAVVEEIDLAKQDISNARAEYLRQNGRDVDVQIETFP